MVSKQDLERIIAHDSAGGEVLSLFLDMSVNSDNKRTYRVFLNQRRAQYDELDSERPNHPREAIGQAFQRVDDWLETEYAEENRGVVIYAELGGEWFEALQFPVPVPNRLVISDRPAVSPLAQVLESYDHHGVVLLDRERVRILSVYLGTLLDEIEVHGEPYPTPHNVQAGGYSQMRFQRRKLEEMRHFFKEFAKEVDDFVRKYQPAGFVASLPFLVRAAQAGFEQVDRVYEEAARTLGRTEVAIFFGVTVPLAWRGILAGVALGFARAMGEFGATLMVAGNLPHRTQTASIAIYDAVQAFRLPEAHLLALALSGVTAVILFLLTRVSRGGGW